ncbi:hypothetical protein UY3_09868 [Chelonia mydas]|uniref:Uncharacterized protein n=1 Tax=Chelonia mydas TaxID=8469 RepID=M7BBQ0_CHEMY|nr:hypothetical protein UY3_09868 [Chelonia mydas]
MESALRPQVAPETAPASSVHSTPASVWDVLAPRKDSSKEHQCCSLAREASATRRHRAPSPVPCKKSWDDKKLDLFCRKVYSTGGSSFEWTTSKRYSAAMPSNSWSSLAKFQELLLGDSCKEFRVLLEEGRVVSRTSLQAALDVEDSATRTMATAITMRCSAWLQVSGIPPEVQNTIQNLPFDCAGLFAQNTDSRLYSLKDSQATLKSLGIHIPAPPKKAF